MIERILFLLKKHKVTAKSLTEQLGINASSVSEWKSGKIKPSIEALIRISLIFNVTLDWLLTGEGEMYRNSDKKDSIAEELPTDEKMLLNNYRKLSDGCKFAVQEFTMNMVMTSEPPVKKQIVSKQYKKINIKKEGERGPQKEGKKKSSEDEMAATIIKDFN